MHRLDPDRLDPDRLDPDRLDPDRLDPDRLDPDRLDPDRLDPDRLDPDRLDPDRLDPDRLDPDRLDPDRLDPDRLDPDRLDPDRLDAVHDVSLLAWAVLAVVRAAGRRRAGPVDALVVAVNLVSGTPAAWRRAREGRRDVVALTAPVAVACAVVTTARARPPWAPVAATAALIALRAAELNRTSEP